MAWFEMTYFDLLLSRGMNAPEASATALSMFPIAGKAAIKNVPIPQAVLRSSANFLLKLVPTF